MTRSFSWEVLSECETFNFHSVPALMFQHPNDVNGCDTSTKGSVVNILFSPAPVPLFLCFNISLFLTSSPPISDLPAVPPVGATDLTAQSPGRGGRSSQCWEWGLSATRLRPASLMMTRVSISVWALLYLSLPSNLGRAEKSLSKFGHEIDKIMIKRNLKLKSNNLPQV